MTNSPWIFALYRGWYYPGYVGIISPWNKDPVIKQSGWLMVHVTYVFFWSLLKGVGEPPRLPNISASVPQLLAAIQEPGNLSWGILGGPTPTPRLFEEIAGLRDYEAHHPLIRPAIKALIFPWFPDQTISCHQMANIVESVNPRNALR